jgi:hypothetical protein
MDPLHNGTIFRLDKTTLERIRSPSQRTSPALKQSLVVRTSEPIIGIREKFEDLYRSTPNPLLALTSKATNSTPGGLPRRNYPLSGSQDRSRIRPEHVNPIPSSSYRDQLSNDALSWHREDEEGVSQTKSDRKRVTPSSVPVHENHQQAPTSRRSSTSTPSLIINESISEEDIEESSDSDVSSESESESVLGDDDMEEEEEEKEDQAPPQIQKNRYSTPSNGASGVKRAAVLAASRHVKNTPLLPPRDIRGAGRTPHSDVVYRSRALHSPTAASPNTAQAARSSHKRLVQSDTKPVGGHASSAEAPSRKRGRSQADSLNFLSQLVQDRTTQSPVATVAIPGSKVNREHLPVALTEQRSNRRRNVAEEDGCEPESGVCHEVSGSSQDQSQKKALASRALAQESRKQTTSSSSARSTQGIEAIRRHLLVATEAVLAEKGYDFPPAKKQRGTKKNKAASPHSDSDKAPPAAASKKDRAKHAVMKLTASASEDIETKSAPTVDVPSKGTTSRGSRQSGKGVSGLVGIGMGCGDGQLVSGRTRSRVRDSLSPAAKESSKNDAIISSTSITSSCQTIERSLSAEKTKATLNSKKGTKKLNTYVADDQTVAKVSKPNTTEWTEEEVKALRMAHKHCPITVPDFWEQVAAEVNRVMESSSKKTGHQQASRRTSNDCQSQWFHVSVTINVITMHAVTRWRFLPTGFGEERWHSCQWKEECSSEKENVS